MDQEDSSYLFAMEDIDRRIKISKVTKSGEQLFLYRRRINIKDNLGYCSIYSQYYIVNALGETVGRVPICIGNPHSLSIDYWLKRKYQGKGIGTVVLEEIVKQIYSEKEFDKLSFISIRYPDIKETAIQNIELEISEDNEASKRIAMKNGFSKVDKRYFSLTLEDYMKQIENTVR